MGLASKLKTMQPPPGSAPYGNQYSSLASQPGAPPSASQYSSLGPNPQSSAPYLPAGGPPSSSYPSGPQGSYPSGPSGPTGYPSGPTGSYPSTQSGSYPSGPTGSYPSGPTGAYPSGPAASYMAASAPGQYPSAPGSYAPPTSKPGQQMYAPPPSNPGQSMYAPPSSVPPPSNPGQPTYAPPSSGPPMSAPGQYPSTAAPTAAFSQKLESVVRSNKLERFYPPGSLQRILEKVSKINFSSLAAEWRIPTELCYDLVALSLYDIVVFCDDSGSMRFEDNGARINELRRILAKIAQVATLFDDDGILIRFFNSPVEGNGIRNAQEADAIVSQVQFNGMTPIGSKLQSKILDPFVSNSLRTNSMSKPVLVFVITDGEPSGEPRDHVFTTISNCVRQVETAGYGKGVAFEFAQVGAQKFLNSLDNEGATRQHVDTTSYYELEYEEFMKKGIELSPELWLVKMMLGAIDPSYDEQD